MANNKYISVEVKPENPVDRKFRKFATFRYKNRKNSHNNLQGRKRTILICIYLLSTVRPTEVIKIYFKNSSFLLQFPSYTFPIVSACRRDVFVENWFTIIVITVIVYDTQCSTARLCSIHQEAHDSPFCIRYIQIINLLTSCCRLLLDVLALNYRKYRILNAMQRDSTRLKTLSN